MPAIKVGQKKIESLVRQHHENQTDYRDTITTGLCFRIGPRGGVWYFLRRVDGQLYRLRLGKWPAMGIAEARNEVARIEEAIATGKHPKAEQARKRSEESESRRLDHGRLIENAVGEWREHHFPTLATTTRSAYERPLSEFAGAFAGQDMASIKRGDLKRFLDGLTARSKAQGNRAATIIRQLFDFAQDRYDLETNPAIGLKNPAKPTRRKRTLDRQEIRVLWRACELAGYPYGLCLTMALCTGQRIGEIGSMRWRDIADRYWRNSDTKSGERIDIYLASQAQALLDQCPRIGEFVFTNSGDRGIRSDTWSGTSGAMARHIWPRINQARDEYGIDAEMAHFTPHDLRRTVRTGLTGWAGVFPDTAERVLNHSISGLRAHYDYADYRPHVTEALRAWDAELESILHGETATISPLRRQKR